MIQLTTAELVASHLGLATGDAHVDSTVEAVNAYLAPYADELVDNEGQPTAAAKLGATMLAARLHRRRNTPSGWESIDGTVASYVTRSDPDIARLLGLDHFAAPAVS